MDRILTREEAQEVLGALERMKGYGNVFLHHRHTQNPYEQVCEAITTLKARLAEQPAQQQCEHRTLISDGDPLNDMCEKCGKYVNRKPAQQEPGRNHWEDGDVFERIAARNTPPAQQSYDTHAAPGQSFDTHGRMPPASKPDFKAFKE